MGWHSLKRLVIERDKTCRARGCSVSHNLTIDHIIPLSRGGTNTPDNLQAMCKAHNQSKSNFVEWDFLQRMKIALHVDELFTRFRNEVTGQITGLRNSMHSEIDRRVQSKVDKLKGTLYKPQPCVECDSLSTRIRALEEYLGIEFRDEIMEVREYRKIRKSRTKKA